MKLTFKKGFLVLLNAFYKASKENSILSAVFVCSLFTFAISIIINPLSLYNLAYAFVYFTSGDLLTKKMILESTVFFSLCYEVLANLFIIQHLHSRLSFVNFIKILFDKKSLFTKRTFLPNGDLTKYRETLNNLNVDIEGRQGRQLVILLVSTYMEIYFNIYCSMYDLKRVTRRFKMSQIKKALKCSGDKDLINYINSSDPKATALGLFLSERRRDATVPENTEDETITSFCCSRVRRMTGV